MPIHGAESKDRGGDAKLLGGTMPVTRLLSVGAMKQREAMVRASTHTTQASRPRRVQDRERRDAGLADTRDQPAGSEKREQA